jgi:hypothetical protein
LEIKSSYISIVENTTHESKQTTITTHVHVREQSQRIAWKAGC